MISELLKAFTIVKNHIGHGWKDLARSLPYLPERDELEINNEIRVIEYETSGQLKEHAYQALTAWFKHCGRRATIDILINTLREIGENRIADLVERKLGKENSDIRY